MKSYPVAIQLWSVREEAKKDFISVLKKIAEYGYHGVEFAGYHGHTPRELKKVTQDLGLQVPSIHGPIPDEKNIGEMVEAAAALGVTRFVTGLRAENFATLEETLKSAERFEQTAALLKKHGLSLGIHNHGYEFDKRFNGKLPHEYLSEKAPSVFLQIDTYWTAYGGADPVEAVNRCKGRVPLLHVKDGPIEKGMPNVPVGSGRMDWPPIMSAAEKAGVEWLIVEFDTCGTDMMEAVRQSRDFLVSKGWAKK